MADDDRYRWLDDETAERLLRAASVNARSAQGGGRRGEHHDNVETAPTSHSSGVRDRVPSWAADEAGPGADQRGRFPAGAERHPSDRLASVLSALVAEQTALPETAAGERAKAARTGPSSESSAELPGEAAALEAFRAAHADRTDLGTVGRAAAAPEAGALVGRRAAGERRARLGSRRPGVTGRISLAGRPLRAGFVMAMAGCALGGVAVAATTGVLPTPFGGTGTPAASVSPLASPTGDGKEAALGGGNGSPDDSNGPRRGTREGGGSGPSGSPSGEDLAGRGHGKDGKGPKGPGGEKGRPDGKDLSDAEKKAIARALCAAYDNDELSLRDRLRLESVAGGAAGVKRFCDKHGGSSSQSGGSGDSGGIGTPGDGGGSGDGGGDAGGSDPGGDSGGDSGGGSGGPGGDAGGQDGGPGGVGTPSNGGADGSGGGDSGGTDGSGGKLTGADPETGGLDDSGAAAIGG